MVVLVCTLRCSGVEMHFQGPSIEQSKSIALLLETLVI